MLPGTLIIRADASVAMGTGHVMRCLALAQAWQDEGGECIFAVAKADPSIEERLRSERLEIVTITASAGSPQDAAQFVELAGKHHARWAVVDGYQFDIEYQRTLKAAGLKLLLVDDTGHAGAYVADMVLDQNAHATENFYQRRGPYTRLLLGSRYAMLRREFKPWGEWKREIALLARKVLVTVGGADPGNVTAPVIHALRLLADDNLEATIVVGGSNPHGDGLEKEVQDAGVAFRLLRNTLNMPELMANADVAISAAGTSCWEMCFLGLPALLIDIAENQTPVARELDRQGIAIHAGSSPHVTPEAIAAQLKLLLASPERRAGMSERGRRLVDSSGAKRVVSAMSAMGLRLRRAQPGDCELLWEWVNDREVRENSFSTDTVTWETHREWFTSKLADPNSVLYMVLDMNNGPVGQVRYDIEGSRALISISLAARFRGRGHGSGLLALAVEELFQSTSATVIDAYVKPTNEISMRVFARAGFRRRGEVTFAGWPAVHFRLEKNRSS
jgi:UDP-2,4-diacetamido-2,4,6-trideoxy-beta-L-altropyranose hydrolase